MKTKIIATLFLIAGLCEYTAQAQDFTFYRTASAFDRAQLKDVMVAVAALDPTSSVFHSDDMTVLQIKIAPAVTDAQLRGAISSTGLVLQPGTPDLKALYGEPSPIPMYVPTGDARADHARYSAAVEQWNSLHPDNRLPEPIPYQDEE